MEMYVTKKVSARTEKNVVINQSKEKEQAQAIIHRLCFFKA